ncbi:MAG TPA: MarR family transcriptional regulator [Trebonia sp.]|jgi:DNA-binding MarR family transcriptional regulator
MSMRAQGSGETGADASAVNRDILDSMTSLIKLVGGIGQGIASEFDIAPHDLLAMFKLDDVMSMKELAQQMGCDASFVTSVADTLERRGFARRAPSQRDRRVKNLVLTEEGIAAKERLMQELAVKMPWSYALDDTERCCFLGLLKKALGGVRSAVCLDDETRADDTKSRDRSEHI